MSLLKVTEPVKYNCPCLWKYLRIVSGISDLDTHLQTLFLNPWGLWLTLQGGGVGGGWRGSIASTRATGTEKNEKSLPTIVRVWVGN